MKKDNNTKVLLIIMGILLIIIGVLKILLVDNKEEKKYKKQSPVYMGLYKSNEKKEIKIIKSYEQYKEFFNVNEITEDSFKDYNYAVVEIDYDECSKDHANLADYSIEGELITIDFNYEAKCGECDIQYMYFLIPIIKDMDEVQFDLKYHSTNEIDCIKDNKPDEIVNFNMTNDTMTYYFEHIASWKKDPSTFQSNMDSNFNNYNCSECTGPNYQQCPAPSSDKTLCDQPKGYDTKVTDSNIKVYNSDETKKEKGTEVTYATIKEGKIYNLIPGQTYYWESTDNNANGYVKVSGERRTIYSNVRNVRDLGGLEVDTNGDGKADGKLKYGKIFRGPKLVSSTDVTELEKLGITEEIDLRGSNNDPKLSNYVPREIKNYLIYHDNSTHKKDYTTFRQALIDTMQDVINGKNIYFHCAIGTDRTGTMAYFLEGLLGVSKEDRLEDYELSYFYGLLNRNRLHDNLSGSSINPRFKSMYDKYDTNEKIYKWFIAPLKTQKEIDEADKLIKEFKKAMVDKY